MGRIVVTEFISLDGVMEDPSGGEGFERGGWSFKVARGDDGDRFKTEETMNSAAMLLGRRTYETFAGSWPERTGEFADKFNALPKYVVSKTLTDPEWNNTRVLEGDMPDSVARLRDELDGDIVIHGSRQLAQGLLEADLVDELRLMVFPVVVGSGQKLFGDLSDQRPLRLLRTESVGDGVAILVFERARS